MPFRRNFFGESIAQPSTAMSEIDDVMCDKYGDVPSIWRASIYPTDEGEYKFGGSLSFNSLPEDEDTYVEDMSFDGFDSIEDIRAWLIDEIGVPEADIEVEG